MRQDSGGEQPAVDGDQGRAHLSKLHLYQSMGPKGPSPSVLREVFTRRCWSVMIPVRKALRLCEVSFKMLFISANTIRRELYS